MATKHVPLPGEKLFKFIDDFGTFSVLTLEKAVEKAEEKESLALEAFKDMVIVQMASLSNGVKDLLTERTKLLKDADFFVQRSGGQEFLNKSNQLINAKGIFDGIGDFFGGIFGGIFDTVKEILDNILDWLGIDIPGWLECLIELICELPGLLGKLFSK